MREKNNQSTSQKIIELLLKSGNLLVLGAEGKNRDTLSRILCQNQGQLLYFLILLTCMIITCFLMIQANRGPTIASAGVVSASPPDFNSKAFISQMMKGDIDNISPVNASICLGLPL